MASLFNETGYNDKFLDGLTTFNRTLLENIARLGPPPKDGNGTPCEAEQKQIEMNAKAEAKVSEGEQHQNPAIRISHGAKNGAEPHKHTS